MAIELGTFASAPAPLCQRAAFNPRLDQERSALNSAENRAFLRACGGLCAGVCGAAHASAELERQPTAKKVHDQVRLLRALTRTGLLSKGLSPRKSKEEAPWWTTLLTHASAWWRKAGGVGAKPLARGTWSQCGFVFGAVVLASVLDSMLNWLVISGTHDAHNTLFIASLGAMWAMHFAAPFSPLAQPRSVVGGNLVASIVAISFVHLGSGMPEWLLRALVPATAISLMVKLGVTHPPAGGIALALLAAPQNAEWRYVLTPLLAANAIAIVLAVAINNAAPKRQYPIYW